MARKQKFSRNWHKAKAKVSKVYHAIANARRDFLHKASTNIANEYAVVCIENLKIGHFQCGACGFAAHADVVGAANILARDAA